MKRVAVLVPVILCVSGCATTSMRVTYLSDPPGATLYQDGRPVGVTPVQLTYQTDEAFKKGGCMTLRGTTVKWASGAVAEVSSLNACSSTGRRQEFMFIRPDVPGRDIDMNYALQRDRNQIMRRQADAAALNATKPPKPMNCSSFVTGNVINTHCR